MEEVQRLLAVTADTYKGLVELAEQGGTPIPRDGVIPALPAASCEPGWDDAAVAAAVDWHDFEDEGALGPVCCCAVHFLSAACIEAL